MKYVPWALIRAFAVKLNYLKFRSVLGYSQCIKRGSTTGVNEPIIKQKGITYFSKIQLTVYYQCCILIG